MILDVERLKVVKDGSEKRTESLEFIGEKRFIKIILIDSTPNIRGRGKCGVRS